MGKLKLTVSEETTRICKVPDGKFDFLGYSSGGCIRRGTLSTRHLSSSEACTPTGRSPWPDRAMQKICCRWPHQATRSRASLWQTKNEQSRSRNRMGDNYGASCIVGADRSSSVERSGRHGGGVANLRNHRLSANAAPTYGAEFRHCSRAIARPQSHACEHASIPGSDWRLNPPLEARIRGQGGKPGAQLRAGHRSLASRAC
jgi:hypothetical protein